MSGQQGKSEEGPSEAWKALCPLADALLSRAPKRDAVVADPTTGRTARASSCRGSALQSAVKRDPQVRKALAKCESLGSDIGPSSEPQDALTALIKLGFIAKATEDPRGKQTGHYLVRIDPPQIATRASFDRGDSYLWLYEGSKTRQTMLSLAFLLVVIGLFLIRLWPIWLKIAIYWVSLTLLVTEVTLIGVRIVLWAIMWVLGFKGIWLFPNLFSEELGIADSFVPIFGTGIDDEEVRRIRRRELRKKKKEEEDASAASAAAAAAAATDADAGGAAKKGAKPSSLPQHKGGWHPGWANAIVLVLVGFLYCYHIGLFTPALVPDFVATHGDLFEYFPAIGPPPEEAETKSFRVDPKIAMERFNAEEAEDAEEDNGFGFGGDSDQDQDQQEMPEKTPEPEPEPTDEELEREIELEAQRERVRKEREAKNKA